MSSPSPKSIELKELPPSPRPIQIVSIGTSENQYAFTFHENALNSILSQIPPGWKVSVISVVGAFRTGKSFLLSWFLRYLHHLNSDPSSQDPSSEEGEEEWYNQFNTLEQTSGFHWRGGVERDTTGIWMWSKPHFLKRNDEEIGVLLIDTQGMFDHDTTMGLTAAIFGLSTLLSSYQIYNVDKKIQEDNLQQLALFSEYGRMALREEHRSKEKKPEEDNKEGKKKEENKTMKPFQHIEFLVRDWQHFECDGEGDFEELEREMSAYLEKVLEEKNAKDLQDTREQITGCFEDVDCFMLTHPGFAVTKKKYDGSVNEVDPTFLRLLGWYCRRVFDGKGLQPKKIHGRELTASELNAYIKAYAGMFADGAHFPEASTMLEATAAANNVNATETSLKKYREGMDQIAGPNTMKYMKKEEFEKSHRQLLDVAMKEFDSIATFGSEKWIDEHKEKVIRQIRDMHEMYLKLNESRNPFAGLEIILIPLFIGILSYILRKVSDSTCSSWSDTCRASSDILSEIQIIVFFFILIVGTTKMKQFRELFEKIKNAIQMLMGGGAAEVKQKDD